MLWSHDFLIVCELWVDLDTVEITRIKPDHH